MGIKFISCVFKLLPASPAQLSNAGAGDCVAINSEAMRHSINSNGPLRLNAWLEESRRLTLASRPSGAPPACISGCGTT